MVEVFFKGGAKWVSRSYVLGEQRCLLDVVRFVRGQVGHDDETCATNYLARRPAPAHEHDRYQSTKDAVIAFNDAPRRSYRQIAAVLRAARDLPCKAGANLHQPRRSAVARDRRAAKHQVSRCQTPHTELTPA